MRKYWICENETQVDSYVEFRITFESVASQEVALHLFGSSWFNAYFNGVYIAEGPNRFDIAHPEYEIKNVKTETGINVVYAVVQYIGCETRLIPNTQPFFACEVYAGGAQINTSVKCRRMTAFTSQIRRINPQLGWMEICDMNKIDDDAKKRGYVDTAFEVAVEVVPFAAREVPLRRNGVIINTIPVQCAESGTVAEYFGYLYDEIPSAFYLRPQNSEELPAMGKFYRYDLGRVRLGRLSLDITAKAGTRVEIAYSEMLLGGRVVPHINLSAGSSANIDMFFCREGRQTICTQTPKGGRYAEVHVIGDNFTVHGAEYLERTYYGDSKGSFKSGDELIDRIWTVGVDTLRACSEDAVIDNPTRERGQWTGDVLTAGLEIAASAFDDYGIFDSAIRQSAYCANDEGLIAGLCPGGIGYLSTYAMQWSNGIWNYFTKTGDKEILKTLFPYALSNIEYFLSNYSEDGLSRNIAWTFVDWGYVTNEGITDMAANLHLISSLRAMIRVSEVLGETAAIERFRDFENRIIKVINAYLSKEKDYGKIGLHRSLLLLAEGFLCGDEVKKCINFIKEHYMRSFPNNPDAPRLSAPDRADMQLITPYFSGYAFPVLIEHGEYAFVLEQFKSCWGWMLKKGCTTWYEVFDERWTHCHQWAGCPTGLLSRFSLGVSPRYDIENCYYVIDPYFTGFDKIEGEYPVHCGGKLRVEWKKENGGAVYEISSDRDVTIEVHKQVYPLKKGECRRFDFDLSEK